MKRIIAIVLFLMVLTTLSAQTISIKGKAQGRFFDKVQVVVYADRFSHLKRTIAETTTDDQGNFSLTFDYEETCYALLKIELLEGAFYLKPGAAYSFDVFPDTAQRGSVYDRLPLQFNLTADDEHLNENMGRYNAMYDAFLINNFKRIYRSRDLTVINEFRKAVEDVFSDFHNDFFNTYIKYSIAQLEWVSKKMSTKTIVSKYFVNSPIHYNNIQYAEFFKSVFKEYVVSRFYPSYFNQFVEIVKQGSLKEFEEIVMKDDLLAKNPEIRDLVEIQMVYNFYNEPDFSKKGALELLAKLHRSNKSAACREIADDYFKQLTILSPGMPAPYFELPVSSGKTYSPDNFKGQVVVFDFMKADCNVCLNHFDFLKDLSSRMGSKLKIVILAYGDHPDKITQLVKNQGLNWIVLYVGKRIDILDDYQVKIFPTYIILNSDATIAYAPAAMADEYLENQIIKVLNSKQK